MSSRTIYIHKYMFEHFKLTALRCRREGRRARPLEKTSSASFCPTPTLSFTCIPKDQIDPCFSKLSIAQLCFSPHSGQPWEQIPIVLTWWQSPKGMGCCALVNAWFMASRGKERPCSGIALHLQPRWLAEGLGPPHPPVLMDALIQMTFPSSPPFPM